MHNPPTPRRVSILDTTLRDGEQTPLVAYTPAEKLHIARRLLQGVGVDRVEVATTGSSPGEREACRRILEWARGAGCLDRVEVLGLCDASRSAQWLAELGGRRLNLLVKGSERHCREQLGLAPSQHVAAARATVAAARALGLEVSAYLEDWSRGVVDAPDYVWALSSALARAGVRRLYLADTLGCLAPSAVARHVARAVARLPGLELEFHGHDDYGLATANCLAAVQAGASGVHTCVNGLGERAGNARLAEVVAALHDHAGVRTGVDERQLGALSALVETFSGKLVADNAPIVGRDVFTQTAGVHADGDRKGALYVTSLSAERFGRRRDYALGKLSGRASVQQNLERLGIELCGDELSRVLARVVELGDAKHPVHPEDLPFLVNDVLGRSRCANVSSGAYEEQVRRGARPRARVEVVAGEHRASAEAEGDGGFDALLEALRCALAEVGLVAPRVSDFRVRIPPGGGSAALVETSIRWGSGPDAFTTVGVDPDQVGAAVIATEKMLARLPLAAAPDVTAR